MPAVASKLAANSSKDTKASEHRRRQLERRDTDSQVQRELNFRFPELSSVDTDIRKIDGKTLRQTIRDDKQSAKAEGRKLSSTYWSALKTKWVAEDSPASYLVVQDYAILILDLL